MLLQNAECNIDYHNNGSLYTISSNLTTATHAHYYKLQAFTYSDHILFYIIICIKIFFTHQCVDVSFASCFMGHSYHSTAY